MLVSPYLGLVKWDHARQAILGASSRGIRVVVYLRDQEESEGLASEIDWLVDQGVKVKLVPNLHAKIYANETAAVVSSMNLTAYSTSNSREIAIQVDRELTEELLAYIKTLDQDAEPLTPPAPARAGSTSGRHGTQPVDQGSCIRCGRDIDLDPDRPLCRGCYQVWSQYSNPDFEERYCLVCGGEKRGIIYAKPLCYPCYSKV